MPPSPQKDRITYQLEDNDSGHASSSNSIDDNIIKAMVDKGKKHFSWSVNLSPTDINMPSRTQTIESPNGNSTPQPPREPAVLVRRAFKSYGTKKNAQQVLDNLNMTVGKGTIYGLLGASGCGKTTLLSCIVGRRRLDAGEIYVLGGKPGKKGSGVPGKRVGYMPQEIALFGEFSIRETMCYFGWIFGMTTPEITERLHFLLNFLDLPSEKRLVKNLSGGQQRRVSFAVALMHDPELLILDEPTVGVDPLLRQSIWNHLVQITKSGEKTVIITTHYIEEARQAHCIGLMRSGRLLAEEAPATLLTHYQCKNLEEVFLKLSRQQNQNSEVTNLNFGNNISLHSMAVAKNDRPGSSEDGVVGLNFYQSKEVLIDQNGSLPTLNKSQSKGPGDSFQCIIPNFCKNLTTRGKLKALLVKCFLRMWRNVGVMLFIFALPVMQVILFCLAIGRDPTGLHIAIVNDERNGTGNECYYKEGCSFVGYGCRYIKVINETMEVDYYDNIEEAKLAVKGGDAWGAIHIGENFTDAFAARGAAGNTADEETVDQSEIKVWLDMSNQQIGLLLSRDLQFGFRTFAQQLLEDCYTNPKLADIPIQFLDPIYGTQNPTFTDFVAPGVILTIVFFLAVALTSSALIIERTEGLLDRSWVAGVSPGEILFSHVVTQFVVMCGQTALVLVFMLVVFGVKNNGNLLLVIFLPIIQGLCGMCFGFVISAVCKEERNAIQLALGSFYPTLLLSGVIWPIEGMPIGLRYFATILPLTLATSALRSILARGWDIMERQVYLGFISTGTWIVIFLIITMLVLRSKRG